MRLHPALLSATLLGCASGVTTPNATNPHGGSQGEVYGTQLSADTAAMGDSVAVTLTIANPTSGSVRLVYGAPFTFAHFTHNDTTLTTVSPSLAADTIVLAAGADTALATIMVHLSTFPLHPLSTAEVVGIQAGTYDLAACAWVPTGSSAKANCGPTVQFTVTP
jgi:hypothetical protein